MLRFRVLRPLSFEEDRRLGYADVTNSLYFTDVWKENVNMQECTFQYITEVGQASTPVTVEDQWFVKTQYIPIFCSV